MSPEAIKVLIAQFIVNDVLPLSTVEPASFRKLINTLLFIYFCNRKSLHKPLNHLSKKGEGKL